MEQLIQAWRLQSEYLDILRGLRGGHTAVMIGLPQLPKAAMIAAAFCDTPGPMLVLTPEESDAMTLAEDLQPFLGEKVKLFPGLELLPFEVYAHNIEVVSARVDVLSGLVRGKEMLVVASIGSVCRRLAPPAIFRESHVSVGRGDVFDMAELGQKLADMGYERVPLTEIPGNFSVRGSIIDIFPITSPGPYRIEFFDDEVDSIRFFDPADQLSGDETDSLIIPPGRELPVDMAARKRAGEQLRGELERIMPQLHGENKKNAHDIFDPLLASLDEGIWDNTLEILTGYFYEDCCGLLDYLPESVVVICEPQQVRLTAEDQAEERSVRYCDMLEQGKLLPSFFDNFIAYEEILSSYKRHHLLLLCQLGPMTGGIDPVVERNIAARDLPNYTHDPDGFLKDMRDFAHANYQIIISASSELRLQRAREILRENCLSGVRLVKAGWSAGFESPSLKIALITEKELFSKEGRARHRRTYKGGERINNFLDLRTGDYVVHIYQGIGQYMGVERLTVGDIARDYLLIRYAGEDKLYLPVDQLDLIQKYIGNEGNAPKLNKLGGSEWNRTKAKVRAEVEEMAQKLLALYAAREQAKGFAFSPDTPWQIEFEDAFPYVETDDQLSCIEEIKKDMESQRVMDRLLCGDVGFGKTEVALRAAFKAVMDSKQVAFLVPTTVLAQQHYNTIKARFEGFPIKFGCLSRFTTPADKKKILAELAAGEIDIVVGTHALLAKNVEFKDLGLLIIDEEQRFGVTHKEKIKALKNQIDVLTLSATPIPRTLHMSLVGMRDMSLITTPPLDRHPVQTYVVEHHERLIRDAIAREMARGGQVFFLHNRVFDIMNVVEDLQRILPEARIIVAHGQMKERELEQAMMDFVDYKADVMVCTTIIESGLDIPNVNTLIVDDADTFGLAQLYQLRGRVGRSQRQAFAYFTFRRERLINEVAKKRLIAIRDFTELGSGFKIAMRDLELRGAGNILGPQQHGNIVAVGFDLYCKLLEEEVARASGKELPQPEQATQLELGINSYIPDDFVSDAVLKVEIYKRMAAAESEQDVDVLAKELRDRYGELPDTVVNLCLTAKIKSLCRSLCVASIFQRQGCFEIKFAARHPVTGQALVSLCQKWGNRVAFSDKKGFAITLSTRDLDNEILRADTLLNMLRKLWRLIDKDVNKSSH